MVFVQLRLLTYVKFLIIYLVSQNCCQCLKQPYFLDSFSILHFYFFAAYLTAFNSGLSVSWTSPVIPKFKTEENPFNATVSTTQVAMLTAFLPLGAISGPILAGKRFYHKLVLLIFLAREKPSFGRQMKNVQKCKWAHSSYFFFFIFD